MNQITAKRIVVDVDTQHDFMISGGALYVPADASVHDGIRGALVDAAAQGVPIIGSVDSHAYDAWEFMDNGGPFPAHCVKGTRGWLRVNHDLPARSRFVPMQPLSEGRVRNLVGERVEHEGNRELDADGLADEAIDGVGLYFEKEVYSLFSNPVAASVIAALVERLGGPDAVRFDVIGYCTGGYCVDAAVRGLLERGYRVRVLGACTAAIGGDQGGAESLRALTEAGAEWIP
jgi:nicotinamidase/pyrazinamidase